LLLKAKGEADDPRLPFLFTAVIQGDDETARTLSAFRRSGASVGVRVNDTARRRVSMRSIKRKSLSPFAVSSLLISGRSSFLHWPRQLASFQTI
jgi:hypothetical protein